MKNHRECGCSLNRRLLVAVMDGVEEDLKAL